MDWLMINKKKNKGEAEDKISELSDGLIHHILWFCDAQIAVQTSVLSKRWKLIWTSLTFLNFKRFRNSRNFDAEIKFTNHFFFLRNYDCEVLKLNLYIHFPPEFETELIVKFITYAIVHNVRELYVDVPGFDFIDTNQISRLRSDTIRTLVLSLNFDEFMEERDFQFCWHLPALTTLQLIRPYYWKPYKLSELCLEGLPALQTLLLDGFVLPNSICLPALTTLVLHIVENPETCDMFYYLENLRNLKLFFWTSILYGYDINCLRLVNLEIHVLTTTGGHPGHIYVSSRKMQNFSSVGFFPIKFGVAELENVNIKFGVSEFPIVEMFRGLGSTKILTLTLDLRTIETLSSVLEFLVRPPPPPFLNLKYVNVPAGYKISSMSTYLKHYLLGPSPKATIITTLSQNNKISLTGTSSVITQNMVLQKPLAVPTKALIGSKIIDKTVCIDTVNMGVQEEHVVQSAAVEGTRNDRVSSSGGDSAFSLWLGHEVNSEFVCLLDMIMNKYPETFGHFTTINKKFCTMKLNMLCTSVNVFTKICMNQVDTEMIAEHRAVFTALQNLGFNVSWLVNRLNFIERIRFSQPLLPELHEIDCEIDNAKSKLQDLQIHIKDLHTLRAEKMQEIQKAFGTMGANLLVGCIGDDLLSDP